MLGAIVFFMVVDKKNLSERLKKVGLNKVESSGKDASIELLSSFYLSITQNQDQEPEKKKIHPITQKKIQTERIAQRAVKILGEAIGKK